MAYRVLLEPDALKDIQDAIDYYDKQQSGLSTKFESVLNEQIGLLRTTPHFQVRYNNVRCVPIKHYPYMIHFTINEENQSVIVRAVFHTSLDPKKWIKRD